MGAQPTAKLSAPHKPMDPEISVREAIQAASEILDRLETPGEVRPSETSLELIEHYIKVVERKEPTNPRLTYLRGRALALAGRPGDASGQLLQFVETRAGRTEWRAFRILGDLFRDEFPRLAKSNYDKAAALNPGEPTVLLGQSVCAMKLGSTTDALSFARDAVAADGRRTVRYVAHLASVLVSAKQWDEALREAGQALTLAQRKARADPAAHEALLVVDAQFRLLISVLHGRIREPGNNSVDDYLRLVTSVRQHLRIAEKLALHNVLAVIETRVEKATPNTPPTLLREYGVLLAEVDRTADAITAFERLLQIDPADTDAADWLNRLRPDPQR